jgi:hypothetical protein
MLHSDRYLVSFVVASVLLSQYFVYQNKEKEVCSDLSTVLLEESDLF